jgi:hypothetical protein
MVLQEALQPDAWPKAPSLMVGQDTGSRAIFGQAPIGPHPAAVAGAALHNRRRLPLPCACNQNPCADE